MILPFARRTIEEQDTTDYTGLKNGFKKDNSYDARNDGIKKLKDDVTVQNHMYRIEEKLLKLDREKLKIVAFFSCTRYKCKIEAPKARPKTFRGQQIFAHREQLGAAGKLVELSPLKFMQKLEEKFKESKNKSKDLCLIELIDQLPYQPGVKPQMVKNYFGEDKRLVLQVDVKELLDFDFSRHYKDSFIEKLCYVFVCTHYYGLIDNSGAVYPDLFRTDAHDYPNIKKCFELAGFEVVKLFEPTETELDAVFKQLRGFHDPDLRGTDFNPLARDQVQQVIIYFTGHGVLDVDKFTSMVLTPKEQQMTWTKNNVYSLQRKILELNKYEKLQILSFFDCCRVNITQPEKDKIYTSEIIVELKDVPPLNITFKWQDPQAKEQTLKFVTQNSTTDKKQEQNSQMKVQLPDNMQSSQTVANVPGEQNSQMKVQLPDNMQSSQTAAIVPGWQNSLKNKNALHGTIYTSKELEEIAKEAFKWTTKEDTYLKNQLQQFFLFTCDPEKKTPVKSPENLFSAHCLERWLSQANSKQNREVTVSDFCGKTKFICPQATADIIFKPLVFGIPPAPVIKPHLITVWTGNLEYGLEERFEWNYFTELEQNKVVRQRFEMIRPFNYFPVPRDYFENKEWLKKRSFEKFLFPEMISRRKAKVRPWKILTEPANLKHIGERNLFGQPHGMGVGISPCGSLFEGYYWLGKRLYGRFIAKDGYVYEGFWVDGKMQGRGLEITYAPPSQSSSQSQAKKQQQTHDLTSLDQQNESLQNQEDGELQTSRVLYKEGKKVMRLNGKKEELVQSPYYEEKKELRLEPCTNLSFVPEKQPPPDCVNLIQWPDNPNYEEPIIQIKFLDRNDGHRNMLFERHTVKRFERKGVSKKDQQERASFIMHSNTPLNPPPENRHEAPKDLIDLPRPNESDNLLNLVLHFSKADGNLVGVTVCKGDKTSEQKDPKNQQASADPKIPEDDAEKVPVPAPSNPANNQSSETSKKTEEASPTAAQVSAQKVQKVQTVSESNLDRNRFSMLDCTDEVIYLAGQQRIVGFRAYVKKDAHVKPKRTADNSKWFFAPPTHDQWRAELTNFQFIVATKPSEPYYDLKGAGQNNSELGAHANLTFEPSDKDAYTANIGPKTPNFWWPPKPSLKNPIKEILYHGNFISFRLKNEKDCGPCPLKFPEELKDNINVLNIEGRDNLFTEITIKYRQDPDGQKSCVSSISIGDDETLKLAKDKDNRIEQKFQLDSGDWLVGIRAHAKALAWDGDDYLKATQWAANLWQLQFIVASETSYGINPEDRIFQIFFDRNTDGIQKIREMLCRVKLGHYAYFKEYQKVISFKVPKADEKVSHQVSAAEKLISQQDSNADRKVTQQVQDAVSDMETVNKEIIFREDFLKAISLLKEKPENSDDQSLKDTNFETIFASLEELQASLKIKEAVSFEFFDSMFVAFEKFKNFLDRTEQISILKALSGDATVYSGIRTLINQLKAKELTYLVEMFTKNEDFRKKKFFKEDKDIYGLCLHYIQDKDQFDVDKFFADLEFYIGYALIKPQSNKKDLLNQPAPANNNQFVQGSNKEERAAIGDQPKKKQGLFKTTRPDSKRFQKVVVLNKADDLVYEQQSNESQKLLSNSGKNLYTQLN